MSAVLIRSLMAAAVALLAAIVTAPPIIRSLVRLRVGQVVRDDGPASHLAKTGTPSMGGVIMLIAALAGSIASAGSHLRDLGPALFVSTGCGLVGMLDDYISIVAHRSLGLRARQKLLLQLALGLVLGAFGYITPGLGSAIVIPFTRGVQLDLGVWYIPFVALVLVSATNAVNLTDGLDGLAGGTVAIASFAYVAIASRLGLPAVGVFAGAVGGAALGFVWWNAHPAAVFMGDTGSLALGAALASMAVMTRTELLLIIVGGVFVAETLSVAIQVISFKLTRKRVFRMAPLHHHFELAGVAETKIVVRFWIVAAFFAALGSAGL